MKQKIKTLMGIMITALLLSSCGTRGEVGPQGPQGEQGIPGEKGEQGVAGKDGKSILTGEDEPDDALGNDGDSYIDLDSWDYYVKENGEWVYKGNIQGKRGYAGDDGKDGKDGENGKDGADGKDGATVLTGEGEPSASLGKNDDSYINLSNWDYYLKKMIIGF